MLCYTIQHNAVPESNSAHVLATDSLRRSGSSNVAGGLLATLRCMMIILIRVCSILSAHYPLVCNIFRLIHTQRNRAPNMGRPQSTWDFPPCSPSLSDIVIHGNCISFFFSSHPTCTVSSILDWNTLRYCAQVKLDILARCPPRSNHRLVNWRHPLRLASPRLVSFGVASLHLALSTLRHRTSTL